MSDDFPEELPQVELFRDEINIFNQLPTIERIEGILAVIYNGPLSLDELLAYAGITIELMSENQTQELFDAINSIRGLESYSNIGQYEILDGAICEKILEGLQTKGVSYEAIWALLAIRSFNYRPPLVQ